MINNFIKNNFKIILVIIVTAMICISGTVFATGYLAKDISYTKADGTEINVETALNDLYKKEANETQLFYAENGSSGSDITLSDSYKNYKKLQIFYSSNTHYMYETSHQSVVVNVSELANQRNFIVLSGVGFDSLYTYYTVAGYYFSTQENILKFYAYMRRNMNNGDMYYGNQLSVIKIIGIN